MPSNLEPSLQLKSPAITTYTALVVVNAEEIFIFFDIFK